MSFLSLSFFQGAQSIGKDAASGGSSGGGCSDALEKWALVWSSSGAWFERELAHLLTAAEKPRGPMASPGPVGAPFITAVALMWRRDGCHRCAAAHCLAC